ncbi:MAG: hypothetical protein IJY25_05140 [Bacilli bacterium]|nr:hypothetical protein [Bacilli bacterium]
MKKKVLLFIAILGLILWANPVLAMDIYSCESSIKGVLIDARIPQIVSTVITVIKIVVPVLLVIFGMLDLMKGIVAQKDDEIKKGQQIFIKRLISGALVFFVFTIVQLIISFVAEDSEETNIMTCAKCFINGDCTYRFENATSKKCPDGTMIDDTKKFCIEK